MGGKGSSWRTAYSEYLRRESQMMVIRMMVIRIYFPASLPSLQLLTNGHRMPHDVCDLLAACDL